MASSNEFVINPSCDLCDTWNALMMETPEKIACYLNDGIETKHIPSNNFLNIKMRIHLLRIDLDENWYHTPANTIYWSGIKFQQRWPGIENNFYGDCGYGWILVAKCNFKLRHSSRTYTILCTHSVCVHLLYKQWNELSGQNVHFINALLVQYGSNSIQKSYHYPESLGHWRVNINETWRANVLPSNIRTVAIVSISNCILFTPWL